MLQKLYLYLSTYKYAYSSINNQLAQQCVSPPLPIWVRARNGFPLRGVWLRVSSEKHLKTKTTKIINNRGATLMNASTRSSKKSQWFLNAKKSKLTVSGLSPNGALLCGAEQLSSHTPRPCRSILFC